ncbi:hypothetical protein ACHAXR_000942, partial [Thalassiosira sp. AJA248-18]
MFTIRSRCQLKTVIRFKKQHQRMQCKVATAPANRQLPAAQKVDAAAATCGPLSRFELHGYRPSPNLSEDESYMDIVMLITRSSTLRQGSMGCILVKPSHEASADTSNLQENDEQGDHANHISRIIAAATNSSLFKPDDSDVHAEINAIGQIAKCAHPSQTNNSPTTEGATAYITMPPCKRCFGALYTCGIKRIVSRKQHPGVLLKAASKVGIE